MACRGVPYGSQKNVRSRPSLIIFDKGAAAWTIFRKIRAESLGANCRNIYSIDVSAFVSEIHVHNFAGCAGDELSAKSPKQSMKHGSLMLHATARQFPGCSCFLESLGFEGDSWINLESSLFWALAMGNVDNFWLCERSSGEAWRGERRREGGTAFSTHHITHARSFKLFVNCGRILQGLSANVSGRSCNHAC